MKFHKLIFCLILVLSGGVFFAPGCKKQAETKPPATAEVEEKVPDDLPQPADITSAVPQVRWSWKRNDLNGVAAKLGVKVEQFQKKYLAWDGAFDGYGGRIIFIFNEEGKNKPGRPLHQVQLFLWPPDRAKGDKAQQRQQLFDFWDNKLRQRYGKDFKTQETARTKSHIWQPRPAFNIEIRLITDPAADPQLAIYWQREGGETSENEREEEKNEKK
jgi:hypothetical protein